MTVFVAGATGLASRQIPAAIASQVKLNVTFNCFLNDVKVTRIAICI